MSKRKQVKNISDKISELLLPKPLQDPEDDFDHLDSTAAKDHTYVSDEDDFSHNVQLSSIRKGNVKLLKDVDQKYRGKIASRKDFEDSFDEDEDDKYQDSSDNDDEQKVAEFSMRLKQFKDDSDAELTRDSLESEDERMKDTVDSESENDVVDEENDNSADENEESDDGEESDDSEEDSDFAEGDILPASSTKSGNESDASAAPETGIKPSTTNEDVKKGLSVQNQLGIWEKLLEVRIHSQKLLIKSNSLPQFDQINLLKEKNEDFSSMCTKTTSNIANLLDKMCEMQNILLGQYPETKSLMSNPNRKRQSSHQSELSPKRCKYSENLSTTFNDYKDYRNSVLSKWHDRTKVLAPGGSSKSQNKLKASGLDIVKNIEGILANRNELIEKTQLHKGGYEILGRPKVETSAKQMPLSEENSSTSAAAQIDTESKVYSTEIYDDTDFYHTQLRELIEFKTNTSSNPTEMTKQFIELQKLRNKMKKTVDTRASKGRKIRYAVHNKMVNFMARNDPTEWTDEAKSELFSSLFGTSK